MNEPKMTAIELILFESERAALKYGYTDEHIANTSEDYGDGELALAAAAYLVTGIRLTDIEMPTSLAQMIFPWHSMYYIPSPDDRIKELVKAGSMIVKEITRLQKLER